MKIILVCFVYLLCFLPDSLHAQSERRNKSLKQTTKPQPVKSVRGAATVQELGERVFQALQNNDFASLSGYFPAETDLTASEKSTTDEDLQLVLEGLTPSRIQSQFQSDFSELQTKSIEQAINLRELSLSEVQQGAPQRANRLLPLHLILTNAANRSVTITFESLKIHGRLFLFEHIMVKP